MSKLLKNTFAYTSQIADVDIGEIPDINVRLIASVIEKIQDFYQNDGLDSLNDFSEKVWLDLVEYNRNGVCDFGLKYLQMWLAVPPMKLSLCQGRQSLLYNWIMRSLGYVNEEAGSKFTWIWNVDDLYCFFYSKNWKRNWRFIEKQIIL